MARGTVSAERLEGDIVGNLVYLHQALRIGKITALFHRRPSNPPQTVWHCICLGGGGYCACSVLVRLLLVCESECGAMGHNVALGTFSGA